MLYQAAYHFYTAEFPCLFEKKLLFHALFFRTKVLAYNILQPQLNVIQRFPFQKDTFNLHCIKYINQIEINNKLKRKAMVFQET